MLTASAVLNNHLHSVSLHADQPGSYPPQSRWTVVFIFLIICLFPALFVSQRKAMSVIRHHYDPLTCIYLRLPPFLYSHPHCCLCLRIGWIFKRGIVSKPKVWFIFWKKFPLWPPLPFWHFSRYPVYVPYFSKQEIFHFVESLLTLNFFISEICSCLRIPKDLLIQTQADLFNPEMHKMFITHLKTPWLQ